MMFARWKRIASTLGLLLLVCMQAQASGVSASLDRDHVQLGDTVILTLSFDSASAMQTPDLSPLSKDFHVLGQSSSTEQSWINGSVKASYQLQITLRPRRAGTLRIPPLSVGGQMTSALTLHVSPGSSKPLGKPGDPVFVQVKLSSTSPYVGEQVAMDVRLYYQAALISGTPPSPDVAGAQVTRLGGMLRTQTQIGGVRYFVAEQHFALVPRHAGTLHVPPVQFHGQMLNTSPMSGFFNNVQPVTAQSAAHVLTVKPRPAGEKQGAWLPARQLELSMEGLPASGRIQIGEPLTVTVREGATGLSATDLPEPSMPDLPGADVYPDKTKDVTRNNGQWITGSRTRRFAIVPNRAGTLEIPPMTLHWWNVAKDRAETARIPAHALTVVAAGAAAASSTPAAIAQPAPPAMTAAAAAPSPAAAASAGRPAPPAPASRWRLVAMASLALWLATLLVLGGWWLYRRRRTSAATGPGQGDSARSARSLRLAFLAAVRGGDPRTMAQALLAWARAERHALRHLQEVSAQLDDAAQQHAIEMLQRAQFAPRDEAQAHIDGDIAKPFRHGLAWRQDPEAGDPEPLPPLYPRGT